MYRLFYTHFLVLCTSGAVAIKHGKEKRLVEGKEVTSILIP